MADVEADLLIALRAIAGVREGNDFRVRDGDVSFDVDYVGGSSSRLALRASYDAVARAEAVVPGTREATYRASARGGVLRAIRPMGIVLRDEDGSDRMAKAEGISREHQTGDDAFDRAVYVDSPTTDEAVLRAVLNEAVRAAVRELLSLRFDTITLDDDDRRVVAVISGFAHLKAPEEAASRIVCAFASLLRGLPPVAAVAGQHPHRGRSSGCLALSGFVVTTVVAPTALFAIADYHHCTEGASDGEGATLKSGCEGPAAIAAVSSFLGGLAAYFVVRSVARSRMAGHSDSHRRIFYVSLAAFFWFGLVTFVGGLAITYASR